MTAGKALIVLGIVLILAGLFVSGGGKFSWLGRLPGDIHIERENFAFFFPLGTCLLISAILSLVAWLLRR